MEPAVTGSGRTREYLIVPMQPTPNGRLHLGHASGPYLRADVLARQLRRFGHEVKVISGSDVYENWVLLDSVLNRRSPEEACRHFHRLIVDDLQHLAIECDRFINPLDPEHSGPYARIHEEIMDQLVANGRAHLETEWFPVSTGSGRYVVGVWLQGRCPNCRAPGGGNACEECGYHYQPAEILEPRSRLEEGPLSWRQERSWFLAPRSAAELVRHIESCGASPDVIAVARRYVEQTGGRIRLTMPGSWGIKGRYASTNTVMSNTFYAYAAYCGALYSADRGRRENAFATSSNVVTIALIGIDNAIVGIVGTNVIALSHGAFKPFDHITSSHFLNLEGRKFSTSRGHAIWVSDLIGGTSVTADEVRYYLSRRCPEASASNFSSKEFVEVTSQVRALVRDRVAPAQRSVSRPRLDEGWLRRLHAAVDRQAESLAPERLRIAAGLAVVDDWLTQRSLDLADPLTAYWWLKGLAVLAEPYMPQLAGRIWRSLGHGGRPAVTSVTETPSPELAEPLPLAPALAEAEIRPYVLLHDEVPTAQPEASLRGSRS